MIFNSFLPQYFDTVIVVYSFFISFFFRALLESQSWVEPKFTTECFYFTYFCHHISVIPAMRKYVQRMRAIRDMNKLITEIESHESEWKHTALGARNRLLLKKWKEQLKVWIFTIIPGVRKVQIIVISRNHPKKDGLTCMYFQDTSNTEYRDNEILFNI